MRDAIALAARVAALPLPDHPAIADWLAEVDLGDGRLQFRSASFHFTLAPQLWVDLFSRVRNVLNGHHTQEEILSGLSSTDRQLADYLLRLLTYGSVLYDAKNLPLTSARAEINRWLAQRNPRPGNVHAALNRASIVIVGPADHSQQLADMLTDIGFGHVYCRGSCPDYFTASSSVSMPEKVPDLTIVITCDSDRAHLHKINAATLDTLSRWMVVSIEHKDMSFGPTIIPHHTACYACYEERRLSNYHDIDDYLEYHRQLSDNVVRVSTALSAGSPEFSILAGHVCIEAARIVGGLAEPCTIGRQFMLSTAPPSLTGHMVLKLPNCRQCGSSSTLREVWDLLYTGTKDV